MDISYYIEYNPVSNTTQHQSSCDACRQTYFTLKSARAHGCLPTQFYYDTALHKSCTCLSHTLSNKHKNVPIFKVSYKEVKLVVIFIPSAQDLDGWLNVLTLRLWLWVDGGAFDALTEKLEMICTPCGHWYHPTLLLCIDWLFANFCRLAVAFKCFTHGTRVACSITWRTAHRTSNTSHGSRRLNPTETFYQP